MRHTHTHIHTHTHTHTHAHTHDREFLATISSWTQELVDAMAPHGMSSFGFLPVKCAAAAPRGPTAGLDLCLPAI